MKQKLDNTTEYQQTELGPLPKEGEIYDWEIGRFGGCHCEPKAWQSNEVVASVSEAIQWSHLEIGGLIMNNEELKKKTMIFALSIKLNYN